MRTSVAALLTAVACTAAAADSPTAPPPASAGTPAPQGWQPRVPVREEADRAEIAALLRSLDAAEEKGDAAAVAALLDFPVLMVSDDNRGQAVSATWERAQWLQAMAPLYEPLPSVKVEHRPGYFLVTDALAVVTDEQSTTLGRSERRYATRSALLLVRGPSGWRVKAMVDGGWGETLKRRLAPGPTFPPPPP